MKRAFIPFIISVFAIMSCNQTGRIVSDTPIKTNILGVELCKKMTTSDVVDALMTNTDKFFTCMPEKNGNSEVYRSFPLDLNFAYGGLSWSYIDVSVTSEKEVHTIFLVASYESVENAKQQFDSAVELFTKKYGKGNSRMENNMFWTDNVNSVGLIYEASSSINGSDRSFCYLYYTNIALSDKVEEEKHSDI
jgi:hypothetical protein